MVYFTCALILLGVLVCSNLWSSGLLPVFENYLPWSSHIIFLPYSLSPLSTPNDKHDRHFRCVLDTSYLLLVPNLWVSATYLSLFPLHQPYIHIYTHRYVHIYFIYKYIYIYNKYICTKRYIQINNIIINVLFICFLWLASQFPVLQLS